MDIRGTKRSHRYFKMRMKWAGHMVRKYENERREITGGNLRERNKEIAENGEDRSSDERSAWREITERQRKKTNGEKRPTTGSEEKITKVTVHRR